MGPYSNEAVAFSLSTVRPQDHAALLRASRALVHPRTASKFLTHKTEYPGMIRQLRSSVFIVPYLYTIFPVPIESEYINLQI